MPVAKRPSVSSKDKDYGEWSTKHVLLTSTLQLAVPLWIERLRPSYWEHIQERAKVCSQEIAEHGDLILFRGKKEGDTAKAFNHLAEGIACLSFVPGGVKIFGQHWESCLDDDVPSRAKNILTKLMRVITGVLNADNADSTE